MDGLIINKICLDNFRCHKKYRLECQNKTTLVLGENGCGKTSVLEAIYIALQGKSFRAVDKEILRRGEDYFRVELGFSDGEKEVVTYDGRIVKKWFLIRDKKTSRLPKQAKYPVVLFLPEDLHIVATSPTRRREYFDRLISQIDDKYSSILSKYNKTLKQRNELLKREVLDSEMLFSWDVLLARYGVYIREARREIIWGINKDLPKTYRGIARKSDTCEINYKSYTENVNESEFLRLLKMDYERDRMIGHTGFGVHKDDFEFVFNGSPVDGNASRGELRSIILALKFIEAQVLEGELRKKPVVLLDDVFSELDPVRQKSLVENFKEHQVILTSVGGIGREVFKKYNK